MPTIRLGPRDLLEYDARYGVLICRECQYAIQKNALQSHLLGHKIYRDERRRLLSSIAQLNLFEPHQVPLPTRSSPPIDSLPVISGYRCATFGCGNLCASSKRMRRHVSEVHGISEHPDSSTFALPVKLQTFFRGTKLKYFEVTSSPAADTAGPAPLAAETVDDKAGGCVYKGHVEQGHNEQVHDTDTATQLPSPPRVPTSPRTPPGSSAVNLDLETLTYFHHFITSTSLTLPGPEHPRPATHYWQTDVVFQALRRRWLMCGLLAISACHLATLADDTTIQKAHCERWKQFFSEFSAGWQEATKRDFSVVATGVEEEAKKAGGQVRCILHCAFWALAESTPHQGTIPEPAARFNLQSIITTVRAFFVPDFAPYSSHVQSEDNGYQEETFVQTRGVLKMGSSPDSGSFGTFPSSDGNTPSQILIRIRELPYRMAETFGKPNNARDVLAVLSAIAALVECCDISFASDEVGVAWWAMATWLTKVPDHFRHMVSCHSPAALVVLAHWAASLVKRAELCGGWFLRGSAKMILLQIAERLHEDDFAVQNLVGSLIA